MLTSRQNYAKLNERLRGGCPFLKRRDVRAVEGTGLENRRGASLRGFESHSLRHFFINTIDLRKYPRGRRGSPAKGVGWIKPARGFKSLLPRQRKCFIYSQIKHFRFFTSVFVLKKFRFRVVFKTITPKFTPKAHFYSTKNSVRKIFLVEFFYAFCLLLQKIMRNLLRKFAFLSRLFFYISAFCIIVIISFWGNLLFKKNFY